MSAPPRSEIILRLDGQPISLAELARFLDAKPETIDASLKKKLKEHEAKGKSEPLVVDFASKFVWEEVKK